MHSSSTFGRTNISNTILTNHCKMHSSSKLVRTNSCNRILANCCNMHPPHLKPWWLDHLGRSIKVLRKVEWALSYIIIAPSHPTPLMQHQSPVQSKPPHPTHPTPCERSINILCMVIRPKFHWGYSYVVICSRYISDCFRVCLGLVQIFFRGCLGFI